MDFEWDSKKESTNIKKHGLSFDIAIRIFNDNNRTVTLDNRVDYGEERLITVGHIEQRLCVVVYVDKDNLIRIISARKANKREQRKYHGNH